LIELAGDEGGTYRLDYAGDTLATTWHARQELGVDWIAGYVTALGDDTHSDRMLAFIGANGIDTAGVRRIENSACGLCLRHSSSGEERVTYWTDKAAAQHLCDDPGALIEAVGGAALVYFSGVTLAMLSPEKRTALLDVMRAMRSDGARIAFASKLRQARWEDQVTMLRAIESATEMSDFVMLSFEDEVGQFGDEDPEATLDRYRQLGVDEIVVKNGAGPVTIACQGEAIAVNAEIVTDIVDARGAGDAFNGAYLAARAAGLGPVQSAERAHNRAAAVMRHPGWRD
jgi:2-dehydro-3-deoxygluconokinase